MDNPNDVPRSVHLADFLVILTGFLHNLSNSFTAFTEELMELSIYHSNRETKVNKIWDEFSQDLESIQEDTNGD